MVFWVSATLEVPADAVERESVFWRAVTGGDLPTHVQVRAGAGAAEVSVRTHDGEVPPVPEPASFAGVRRSRVYQVCLDIPGSPVRGRGASLGRAAVAGGSRCWSGGRSSRGCGSPEGRARSTCCCSGWTAPTDPCPRTSTSALPTARPRRERHVALGATVLAREEFWTVLADPAGLPYCITDRDPATGELALI